MTRRGSRTTVILTVASVLVVTFALLAPSASAIDPSKLVFARMSGAKEVPGPGDADGKGKVGIAVRVQAERLCFAIRVVRIELPAIAAHVHPGTKTQANPPIVTLVPPDASGNSAGCVAVHDKPLLRDIREHPRTYYVNVHTADFQDGAVRGQLRPVSS